MAETTGEQTQDDGTVSTVVEASAAAATRARATSLDAVLRPIRTGNAFEESLQRILQAIKLGAVTTGEKLPPERELAARLRVSRVTLREALRTLQQLGYVESRRGRTGGTFITYRPDVHESDDLQALDDDTRGRMDDTLRFRAVVEPGAAELAAAAGLDADDRKLLERRLEDVLETRSRVAFRLADARLHLAIAEVTGSPTLLTAVADVQMTLGVLLAAVPILPISVEHSHEQHNAIVGAVLDGRPERARDRMRDHCDATEALLRGFLT